MDDPTPRRRAEAHGDRQGRLRRDQGVRTARSTTEEFSHVIVAVGIVPNTENIGLEALGIATTKRPYRYRLPCAAPMLPGIYAIGDVTQPPWLAHKASHEGVIA
jgi:dihydrolipoamide dehydrogenase